MSSEKHERAINSKYLLKVNNRGPCAFLADEKITGLNEHTGKEWNTVFDQKVLQTKPVDADKRALNSHPLKCSQEAVLNSSSEWLQQIKIIDQNSN